ncbi:hypothetical protein DFH07DRAFT_38839 [Mycena maculata]|uniref:Uncharacterized protein n=1 Tax=Mycena maculata TaxID=230809 RepID=A0AAD7IGR2_9AGAR|nr:hypothetical protein DFH07DRAFT_38839 [Mycena maculata]
MRSAALTDMIVMAAGETRLAAYIQQTFPPEILSLGHYTAGNAAEWLDVDGFTRWLNQPTNKSAQSATTATSLSESSRPVQSRESSRVSESETRSSSETRPSQR